MYEELLRALRDENKTKVGKNINVVLTRQTCTGISSFYWLADATYSDLVGCCTAIPQRAFTLANGSNTYGVFDQGVFLR